MENLIHNTYSQLKKQIEKVCDIKAHHMIEEFLVFVLITTHVFALSFKTHL
jgi:hypothetical protein